MTEQLEMSVELPVAPERVYRAWLDSSEHSAMTGGEAEVEAVVGGRHKAWDGYIEGENLVLEPSRRIVQTWRTHDFGDAEPDSRLEIVVDRTEGGSRLTLRHTNLPEGSAGRYREGWLEYYFEPMRRHFAAGSPSPDATLEPGQDVWDGSRTVQTPQDSRAGLAPHEVRLWDAPPEERKSELQAAARPRAALPAEPDAAPSDEISLDEARAGYFGSTDDLRRAESDVSEPPTRRTNLPPVAAPKKPAPKKPAPKKPAPKKPAPKKPAPKKPAPKKPAPKKPAPKKPAPKKPAPKKPAPKKPAPKKPAPKKPAPRRR